MCAAATRPPDAARYAAEDETGSEDMDLVDGGSDAGSGIEACDYNSEDVSDDESADGGGGTAEDLVTIRATNRATGEAFVGAV